VFVENLTNLRFFSARNVVLPPGTVCLTFCQEFRQLKMGEAFEKNLNFASDYSMILTWP
jgi:hypothetical protein